MRRLRFVALALCVLVLELVAAGSAHPALAFGSQIRTFVATTGSDADPCSRIAPCRTFGAALAQTASGGEIVALDSGGYGTVEIYQAVTIVAAPGVQASISPSSSDAIYVQAGPTDTVVLRNLNLNGQGANYGVHYVRAGSLHLENLTISGFAFYGIQMSVFGASDLYVADTVIRGNGFGGMYLYSTTGARATFVNTRAEQNGGYGFRAAENVNVYVKDSVSSGNDYGFGAVTDNGTAVQMNIEDSVATGNTVYGIFAGTGSNGGSALIRVSNSTVTGNYYGVHFNAPASTLTRGNNTVEGNQTNGAFSGTFSAK